MSEELTKKFKKGELKPGYYFFKTTEDDDIVICHSESVELPEMIEDVIQEVPTYKEFYDMYIQLIRANNVIRAIRDEIKPFGLFASYIKDYE